MRDEIRNVLYLVELGAREEPDEWVSQEAGSEAHSRTLFS